MMKQLFPVICSLHMDHLLHIIWSTLHPLPRTTPPSHHEWPLAPHSPTCRCGPLLQVAGPRSYFFGQCCYSRGPKRNKTIQCIGKCLNNFKSKDSMTVCIGFFKHVYDCLSWKKLSDHAVIMHDIG